MENPKTNEYQTIVLFNLDNQGYALNLYSVERVERAVEITPLPKAPEIVCGVINYHGEIIPVINLRRRFNLPERETEPEDQFIVARTTKGLVSMVVDSVSGIHEIDPNHLTKIQAAFPYTEYLSGIAKVENNIVLIHDLEKFLSLDEQRVLDEAISEREK